MVRQRMIKIKLHLVSPGDPTFCIDGKVLCDGKEPGGEFCRGHIPRPSVVNAKKHFPRQFLSQMLVADLVK